jgi:hypothetical protein
METAEDKIGKITRYVTELVDSGLTETPRKERFLQLLQELYPENRRVISRLIRSSETSVELKGSTEHMRGSMDSFFGDLIIEFERKLPEKKSESEKQLKEYCSGVWNSERKPRNYICIATDGIYWQTYHPRSEKTADFTPQDIELIPKEQFELKADKDSGRSFYYWLSRVFFREGRLKPTVNDFTRDFGARGYLYEYVIERIKRTFAGIKDDPEVALAFKEWSHYLKYTYGNIEGDESLFCRHSYLTVLARLIVWAALPGKDSRIGSHAELISDILNGKVFKRYGITNLVEKDFFHWVASAKAKEQLSDTWLEVLNYLFMYDFDEIGEDLLKGVYQELVDPEARHDLGEYYTPDWLCEEIIEYLFEKYRKQKRGSGVPKMLDPTCGSGSFLRAGIAVFIENAVRIFGKKVNRTALLTAIRNNVVGIDIHPLAVIISKANYVLGLKKIIDARKGPIEIPVYLADSLFAWAGKDETLYSGFKVQFAGAEFSFPESVFAEKSIFDRLLNFAANAAEKMATGAENYTPESLANYISRNFEKLPKDDITVVSEKLYELTRKLAEKVRKNEDTIWSFILRNNYAPAFLHEKFDIIFGNPPWIVFHTIAEPAYQEELRKLGIDVYGVAPRDQKLRTHMEIATIFLVHSVHTYVKKEGGLLGFVMPRSVFSSDHHSIFREGNFRADCLVTEFWDLEGVKPLFNVPSCVVIAEKGMAKTKKKYKSRSYSAKLREKDIPLAAARELLNVEEGNLFLSRLGNRTALTTAKIESTEPSYYIDKFRQGATIVPGNFYFIEPPKPGDLERSVLYVRTDPEKARAAKAPYKHIFLEGNVEREFIYRSCISRHVLPFIVLNPAYVVLPVLKTESGYKLKTAAELRQLGYVYAADWFAEAESHWNRLRGTKAERQNLYDRLNYHNELMNQRPDSNEIFLYNASGTNLSGAILSRDPLFGLFAEHALYTFYADRYKENRYVLGLFNSKMVDKLIKPFQAMGLLGERSIEKKVLEIPFPPYNPKDRLHGDIVTVAETAMERAKRFVDKTKLAKSLGRARNQVREAVSDELKELDKLVKRLLEDII